MATIAAPTLFSWQRALRGATLPPTVQHVLLVLSLYASPDGAGARPGEVRLATDVGLSVWTIRRSLAAARRLGWIVRADTSTARSRAHGLADEYRLTIPAGVDGGPVDNPPGTGQPRPVDNAEDGAPVPTSTEHQGSHPQGTGAWTSTQEPPREVISDGAPVAPPAVAPLARLARVAARVLTEVTGRTVDDQHAAAVARQLVGGRDGLRNPSAYLAACIRRDPNPQRFLPTSVPQRFAAGAWAA